MENKDIKLWKRPEIWASSLAIFVIIGYFLFIIVFGLWWLLKWIIFSPIRPFTNSKFLCEQGFHKYRVDNAPKENAYFGEPRVCIVCGKQKIILYE